MSIALIVYVHLQSQFACLMEIIAETQFLSKCQGVLLLFQIPKIDTVYYTSYIMKLVKRLRLGVALIKHDSFGFS